MSCPNNTFVAKGPNTETCIAVTCHVTLASSNMKQVLHLALTFVTLTLVKGPSNWFCKMPIHFALPDVSPWSNSGYTSLAGKSQKGCCVQNQLHYMQGSLQNENTVDGPLIKKLLRLSRKRQQSIKPNICPFWALGPVLLQKSMKLALTVIFTLHLIRWQVILLSILLMMLPLITLLKWVDQASPL